MNLNLTTATRVGLNLLAVLGVIVALRLGVTIFVPLVIAVLLATILWPSAERLNSYYRLPWSLACLVAVSTLVFLNFVVVLGFIVSVPKLLQSVPSPGNAEAQEAFYLSFRNQLQKIISPLPLNEDYFPEDPAKSNLFQSAKKFLEGEYLAQLLLNATTYVTSYLWEFILILFILLFLLMEGRMLTRRVVEIFGPSTEVQSKVVSALAEMGKAIGSYLKWRTIINIGLGILVAVVYQFLGLKQAWTWGLMTAVLCYIPYLGPIVAGAPPLLDALINCPSPWYALGILVFYTGVITLEGYVIVPLLMGRHMDLNATTVMLACLFWELVWGVPGLFLAMPLMAGLKAICEHVPGWRPWANLMSAHEEIPPVVAPKSEHTIVLDDEADQTVIMDGARLGPRPAPTHERR